MGEISAHGLMDQPVVLSITSQNQNATVARSHTLVPTFLCFLNRLCRRQFTREFVQSFHLFQNTRASASLSVYNKKKNTKMVFNGAHFAVKNFHTLSSPPSRSAQIRNKSRESSNARADGKVLTMGWQVPFENAGFQALVNSVMRVSPKVPLNSCSRSNYGRLPTMTVAATPSSSSDPTLQLGTAFFRHGNAVVEIRLNKGFAGHFFPACGAKPLVSLDFCEYAYTECRR